MTQLGYPPVLPDIVEEHFEELDFLWELRESVIFAPDWNLEELAELEERAEAHLDGLRLAEMHGIEVARPHLEGGDTFAAAAATMVFMQNEVGDPELRKEVAKAMVAATGETLDGIRIGLRHSEIDGLHEDLVGLAAGENEGVAAAAADVLSFHRLEVPNLERLLTAEEPAIQMHACAALGRSRRFQDADRLKLLLTEGHPGVQEAALRAAALSGMTGLEELCRGAAVDSSRPNLVALGFLGIFGNPADLPMLEAAARRQETTVAALAALGALGRVQAIPLLVERMGEDQEHARAAAASFARITGLDDLFQEKAAPAPIDESDIEGEFEDDSPPPDAEKARAAWDASRESLDENLRWQQGLDVSSGAAISAATSISLESARDLHLWNCATRSPGASDVELESTARRRAAG